MMFSRFFILTFSLVCCDSWITHAQVKSVPVFRDGEAQVVAGFKDSRQWIRHDLWVETEFDSDGDGKPDRVHVDVTRQRQTKTEGLKVPVVYNTSPYFKGTGSTENQFMWNPRQELNQPPPQREFSPPILFKGLNERTQLLTKNRSTVSSKQVRHWVPRGYAVVHSCSPGTGLSQGCPSCGGDNESLAPKAVIDWLNGRAKGFTSLTGNEQVKAFWSTGKVGMTGTSYNGTLPFAAATTGVDGLEAIIPVAPNLSYYHYYRSNGLVRHPGGYMGEDIDVLFDFIHSGNPKFRDYCNQQVRDKLLMGSQDRANGDYNDFWADRDYMNDLKPFKAATLFAHGLNDWNVMPSHSIRFYEALKKKGVPCQIYLHQGGHGGPPPFSQMNRWFTRYLHGVKNEVESGPKAWIVRESANRSQPTAYADYPNPDARTTKFYLTRGGNQHGQLTTKQAPDQGQETLVDNFEIDGRSLATLQQSQHRLLYLTKSLQKPMHVSGSCKLHLRLACDRSAANLSVWLVSLPWQTSGSTNANLITRGWADPQNYKSLTDSEPLKPDQFYDVEFNLEPDDQIVPVGQQVGLMIFSSDKDFTLWPQPGTKLTVDLDQSYLELPIVQTK